MSRVPRGYGALYIVWGDESPDESIRSLLEHHPNIPVHIHKIEGEASLLDKSTAAFVTPFENTLYLDCDTVVLDELSFGFHMGARHGLACGINENPWFRRYYGHANSDLVEYNTGVLFFHKEHPAMRKWPDYARMERGTIKWDGGVMLENDQASFAMSVAASELVPFVLPLNWNFRPQFHLVAHGPIKIWHSRLKCPDSVRSGNQTKAPMVTTKFEYSPTT